MGRAEFLDEDPAAPTGGARHVAIIMDGNGRWATQRGLPRLAGHRKGAEAVRSVVEACPGLGVEVLTLYAFSTENWKRSTEEVSGLMGLFRHYMRREAAELARRGAKVRFLGDREGLDADIREMMSGLEAQTAQNDRLTLVIAINYGGRAEIAAAARRLASQVAEGAIVAADISEQTLEAELGTHGLPDPDLVIRTSGEQRISNFLLWQCAYSEFLFVDDLWPDFDGAALAHALARYGERARRFGAVAT
ncbi:MAG: polyprenyl diphosphate synthase [Paracoccaceae bacterium]